MNQKEAIKLAVVENNMKNIETKLDEHIKADRQASEDNKKQQIAILEKLDMFHEILNTKADKEDVEKINKKLAYWAGAIAIVAFFITLFVANADKILRGLGK